MEELNREMLASRYSSYFRSAGKNPSLVLNADYRPLSYLPLSVWSWKDSIKALFMERIDVLAEYNALVNSPSISVRIPSVVVLRDYIKPVRSAVFTRFNLFLRDEFTCQYCGHKDDLTFDHIIPRSKGGRTSWENVVAACSTCNLRKGSKSLTISQFRLIKKPIQPSPEDLLNKGRKFPPNYLHHSWEDFLYWDTELLS